MAYIFGGNTGETPSSLKRKRAIAEALIAKNSRAPQNVGEGLSAIGNALLYRSMMKKVDAADDAGTASAAADRAAFMAGFGGSPSSPSSGVSADIGMPRAAAELAASSPATVDLFGDKQTFIDSLLPAAIEEGNRTGIDPRIIVAQAAQETGWGRSAPGNNFFGIKSHGKGGGQSLATHEYVDGNRVDVTDSFRTFGSPGESVRGYGDFILENPRYEKLRTAQGLDNQLAELQASGYATDPNYSRSVGSIARSIQLPAEVASLDPSIGMETAAGAIDTIAPPSGTVAPPEAGFDSGRFGDRINLAEMPPSRSDLAGNLQTQARSPVATALLPPSQAGSQPSSVVAALASPPAAAGGASGGLPVGEIASTTGRAVAPARGSAVAQALMGNQQLPADYYPPAPAAPSAPTGPTLQQAIQLLNNPYATEADRAMAMSVVERQQQMSDPAYQLEQEYRRAQIDSLRAKPTKEWQKLDDDTLFNPETGETRDVAGAPAADGAFRFEGKSVEAQALNGLMDAGQLTPDQAQQLGAGKTITGPNGEIMFLTPQGVFGQSAAGGPPQPIAAAPAPVDGAGNASVAPTAPTPPAPPVAPQLPDPAGTQPRAGMIPLTEPKVTIDENKAAGFADRMTQSGALIDTFGNAGLSSWPQAVTDNDWIPDIVENQIVGEDFQKFAQARRDFINAQLRRESGAVISNEEFANANKQYFPMPGDTPQVLEQKRKNRETVINAMKRDAGPTYGKRKTPAADVGEMPDFSKMTDEELQRYLDGN